MGLATSLFVLAAGAILAFAVNVTTSGVNLTVVGYILMAVGAFGILLSIAAWESLLGPPVRRAPPPPPPRRSGYPPDEAPTRRL